MFGVWITLAAPARPADFSRLAIEGELTGNITLLQFAGAPALRWRLALRHGNGTDRQAEIAIDGPGTALRGEVHFDSSGPAQWRLGPARVDVGDWLAAMVPHLGAELAGATGQGALAVTGEGTWQNGVPGGKANFRLEGGRIEVPGSKFALAGIVLDLALGDLASRQAAPGQVLTFTGGHADEIEFGAGRVTFSIAGDEVRVEEAAVSMFGGEVRFAPFVFTLGRAEMSVVAQLIGLDIAQLLPLLPPVLAEARGRLDGSVTLRRDASGIQIGAGRLALDPRERVELRFEPTPGLLSQSLPATVLKYYPGLGKIETGEIPIQATLFEVVFTPGGDAEGRSAYVHIAGGPVDAALRAPIDLEINVRGPLEALIKLGTSGRLRFGAP